jgi:hypothetical protein
VMARAGDAPADATAAAPMSSNVAIRRLNLPLVIAE